MTYKIVNKLCPNSFLEKYKPRSSFSSYSTRNSQNLQIPNHRTERYKKRFHYSALKEWNNTLRDISELPTANTFKRQLKLYVKSKAQLNTTIWKNNSMLNRFCIYFSILIAIFRYILLSSQIVIFFFSVIMLKGFVYKT